SISYTVYLYQRAGRDTPLGRSYRGTDGRPLSKMALVHLVHPLEVGDIAQQYADLQHLFHGGSSHDKLLLQFIQYDFRMRLYIERHSPLSASAIFVGASSS